MSQNNFLSKNTATEITENDKDFLLQWSAWNQVMNKGMYPKKHRTWDPCYAKLWNRVSLTQETGHKIKAALEDEPKNFHQTKCTIDLCLRHSTSIGANRCNLILRMWI